MSSLNEQILEKAREKGKKSPADTSALDQEIMERARGRQQAPGVPESRPQKEPDQFTIDRLQEEGAYIGKNILSGTAELLGLPGTLAGLPKLSGEAFREGLAGEGDEISLAYTREEEPDTFEARLLRNLGMISPLGIGANVARSGLKAGAIEVGAAAGAAGGGMAGEQMFPNNQLVGRAVGELIGGLGGGFVGSGGGANIVYGAGSKLTEPFSKAGGKRRATQRVQRGTEDAPAARKSLRETEDIAGEVPELTPAQRTGDPFLSQLENAVKNENPVVREKLINRTAEASRRLKQIAERTGDVEDVRNYLNNRMNEAVARSFKSAARIRRLGGDPGQEALQARKELQQVYEQAREYEGRVWGKVPSDVTASPSNARSAWREELEDLTEGGDRSELPQILFSKLGKLGKKGKFTKGALKDEPSAKALHQFYSVLGRRLSNEANKDSPNANTIRILKKVRSNVLADLEEADSSDAYADALAYSKDLNRKFTSGSVGQLLGYSKSGGPTNANETLEALMGHSGEKQRTAVKEFLEASPGSKSRLENFMRSRFVDASFQPDKGVINTKNAANFLKKNRAVLREFPDLKKELQEAAQDQKKVDDLLGVADFYDFSPSMRQKKSAGIFLNAPPGKEIERVISATSGKPKSTTAAFQELVKEVQQDDTGRALKGLKRAFVEHIMTPSAVEDAQGEFLVNGKKMLQNINSLQNSAVSSGIMSKDEMSRLKKISKVFEGIQRSEKGGASPEGVIGDTADTVVNALARMMGSRLSQLTPSGGAGVGLQEAQIGSGILRRLADKLTVRGATALLTEAVQDPKTMDDLLANVENLGVKEKERLYKRLIAKAQPPQGATNPAAVSAASEDE